MNPSMGSPPREPPGGLPREPAPDELPPENPQELPPERDPPPDDPPQEFPPDSLPPTENAQTKPESRGGGRKDRRARRTPRSNPNFWPKEVDPRAHPPRRPRPVEHEKARPKDTGRSGS
jgi:hypothetical protein